MFLVTQCVRLITFLFEHSVYFYLMNVENEYLSNWGVVLCRNSAHGSDHRYSVVSTSVMIQGLGRLCSCGWRSLGGNWHSAPCAVKYWARQSGAEELRSSSLVLLNSKVLLHTLRSSFLNSCCDNYTSISQLLESHSRLSILSNLFTYHVFHLTSH